MNDCPPDSELAATAAGAADPALASRVRAHAQTCETCALVLSAASQSAEPLGPGSRVGRFVLERLVGVGAMGEVFAARDPELNRTVAIKLLRPSAVAAELGERLRREAQAMARLQHPNVLAVFDQGVEGERPYVAMEYVSGPTLRRWLAEAPRSWREIVTMFAAAGRGLRAAHAAGLVHRDFKADNVIVDASGAPKIGDFGLALELGELGERAPGNAPAQLTATGARVGTPAYMAPEQFSGDRADARTDQFNFSAALYEALYGLRPFAGERAQEIADAVSRGALRPPPANAKVPARIHALLAVGLAAEPSKRHPSLEVLLDALQDDPALRRRRAFIGLAAVCLVLGSLGLLARVLVREHTRCAREADTAARFWNGDRAALVRSAFAKTMGTEKASALATSLESYVTSWRLVHAATCEAERARVLPPGTAELRAECLDRNAVRLEFLVESLRASRPDKAGDVAAALRELPAPQSCAALESPRSAWVDEHRRFEQPLARARLANEFGSLEEAQAAALQLEQLAKQAGARSMVAEAVFQRGDSMVKHQQDLAKAAELMRDAARLAEAAGDEELVARALVARMDVLGVRLDRFAQAEEAAKDAEAALGRLGNALELRAVLDRQLGSMAVNRGDKNGIALLQRARDEMTTAEGPESLQLANVENDLGRAYGTLTNEPLKAAEHLLRASKIYEANDDADDSGNVIAIGNAGEAYLAAGDRKRALEVFDQGAAIAVRIEARYRYEPANLFLMRADVLTELARFADAQKDVDHAEHLLAGLDLEADTSALLHLLRARLALANGDARAASVQAEQALQFAQKPPADDDMLADVRYTLAKSLMDTDPQRARELVTAALAHHQAGTNPERTRDDRALIDAIEKRDRAH